MDARRCKICEMNEDLTFTHFPDICDGCVQYDWGRWHLRRVMQAGGVIGAISGYVWAQGQGATALYANSGAATIFAMLIGAIVGWASADALGSWIFERYIMRAPEPDHEEWQRRREAEKFFYVGMLSAFQGKTQYALRMLRQAERHGWHQWERLTGDPRFRHFCNQTAVRHLVHD
jgi:hypothetical protein